MSSDLSMMSDDSKPLGANGKADHLSNGKASTRADFPLSDDDDLPLSQTTRTKSEPDTPDVRPAKRKRAAVPESSSSDDDTPLASSPLKSAAVPMPGAKAVTTLPANAVNGKGANGSSSKAIVDDYENYDDDDAPIMRKKRAVAGKSKKPPLKKLKSESSVGAESEDETPRSKPATKKRKAKQESEPDESESEELPVKKKKKKVKATVKKERKPKVKDEPDSDGPKPKKVSKSKGKAKQESMSPTKRKKEEEEEAEQIYRWWEAQQENGDDSVKWNTLEHAGVIFPPPYEPLPSSVKMKYNGKDVSLQPEAEEVAGFYAAMIETEHAQDKTFNGNFFDDFKKILKQHPPLDDTKISEFERCDFRPMFEYFESEKAKKKALSTAEKKELKKQKDEMEAPYVACLLDGRKEKVGNFRVEPPGLFRGRGDHPKKGALKLRVRPEDITINIGKDAKIPVPNMPGKWKKVIHDQTVTWLANWTENINGNHKYVFLAAGSSLKGQSDMVKFEKARELKKHVDKIRADYTVELKSKVMADRQRATAMYFIDRLALRAGNEKGDDEADTVGCCSLRCEHVTLEQPDILIFDFLGKDSIRYFNRVPVTPQVFKNIRIFKENKIDEDNIFDRVTTTLLNKHLASYMKGLTAKVFRTYNASITFQDQLDKGTPENVSVQEKLNAYNHANRMVAILCNHQRAAPKTHEQTMDKLKDKIRALKYDRMKLRHVLFAEDAKYKKKPKYAQDESDIDDEWVVEHEESMKKKDIEKAEKKFAKDNEKLAADGGNPQKDSVLKERIKEIEADYKHLEKERGTKKATLKREKPVDKIEEAIEKLDERIKTSKLQMVDREAGKEVALGTSKINYLDPRITAAWCKIHDVPIEKLFSKTLLTKFPWALEVNTDWKF